VGNEPRIGGAAPLEAGESDVTPARYRFTPLAAAAAAASLFAMIGEAKNARLQ